MCYTYYIETSGHSINGKTPLERALRNQVRFLLSGLMVRRVRDVGSIPTDRIDLGLITPNRKWKFPYGLDPCDIVAKW